MRILSDLFFFLKLNLLVAMAVISGCMVGPDYQKPADNIPQTWISSSSNPFATPENTTETIWWQHFHDPVLNQLIAKASSGNLDIKTAETRIAQARATQASATAALLPTGDLMASGTRQQNQLGFPSGGPANLASVVKQPFNVFKSGFDASWELDLFGGHRRELQSAEAELEASAMSQEDVLISTRAEVAKTYLNIRLYQLQLSNALDTVTADTKSAEIIKQRFDAGDVAGLDVSHAEAQLQRDRTQIAYYTNLLAQAEYSMDVLLGEQPGATHQLVNQVAELPLSDKQIVLDAPAMVIANRPDIRNAERKLASATAQQGAAVAKFFPDVSVSGFVGLFNTNAGNFFNLASKSWGAGANVLWPIFSYGTLSANLDAADAKQQEALAKYQSAILIALSDVERSFTAYTEQEKFLRSQEQAAQADEHALDIARQRYQAGTTSLLDVLDAERSLYSTRNQLMLAKAQTSQNLVAVYKSLGGGWQVAQLSGAETGLH